MGMERQELPKSGQRPEEVPVEERSLEDIVEAYKLKVAAEEAANMMAESAAAAKEAAKDAGQRADVQDATDALDAAFQLRKPPKIEILPPLEELPKSILGTEDYDRYQQLSKDGKPSGAQAWVRRRYTNLIHEAQHPGPDVVVMRGKTWSVGSVGNVGHLTGADHARYFHRALVDLNDMQRKAHQTELRMKGALNNGDGKVKFKK